MHFLRERTEMIAVVYTRHPRHPTKGELKALLREAEKHRVPLLKEWEVKVNVKSPGSAR